MSEALKVAIDELVADISAKERELDPLKSAVNALCTKIGIPEKYTIGEDSLSGTNSASSIVWRLDQFTNRPLATCVAEIMETNKSRGLDGPASIDEIFSALTNGGYKFQGISGSDEHTKRGIKIALTKNTAQFVKIREDIFGLKRWYGSNRPNTSKKKYKSDDEPSYPQAVDNGDEELSELEKDITPTEENNEGPRPPMITVHR